MLQKLLRFSLFNAPCPLSDPLGESDWQSLFEESRAQAVTALLYDAILKLPPDLQPPRSILFHFTTLSTTIEQDNRKREKALHDFAATVENMWTSDINGAEKPKLVVVKGSAQAYLYPVPTRRECGDNDLYCSTGTDEIAKIVEELGITVDRKDPRHISFAFEGVTFECHNYLLYHNDDPQWHTEPFPAHEGGCNGLLKLTTAHSAFFYAKHIEHHAVFFHQPVRLRDLVDWAILLNSAGFDYDTFSKTKEGTDVEVFADLMSAYCNSIFGLELTVHMPKGLSADDFKLLYMQRTPRHRLALVRVARRSWKYVRHWHKYKIIYRQSMFRRFYLQNILTALKNKVQLPN